MKIHHEKKNWRKRTNAKVDRIFIRDGGEVSDNIYRKLFQICPLCGSYTRDTASGGERCTCGWSVDSDGEEDFEPDDLEMYEKEV